MSATLAHPETPSPHRPVDGWLIPILRAQLGPGQLDRLLASRPESLWDAVVAQGVLSEPDLLALVAAHLRLPVADLSSLGGQAAELVAERWARKFRIAPLGLSDDRLRIATADPFDLDCERTLAFATGRRVELALAAPRDILARIEQLYGMDSRATAPEEVIDVELLTAEQETAPPTADDDHAASITTLVDELIAHGISGRASDIHIEPDEQGIAVRHRVDGVLHLVRRLPRTLGPPLVSRIKIMSRLDIADRLRPQDGRARVAVNGVAIDLRVSTLPASHGEKVVLRVLDGRATVLTLERMGFTPEELQRVNQLLRVREGLILVTGPTGSGKTTTLYAALRQIEQRRVNIVTVEDPIEYRLPGIVQVQVHERAGLTFASALRSIMRQDPDVLLVGEIRDRETAEIAIQASLTGHLVLSTLHTNDAASAVTRLSDIGVASYKIATAVKGIIAQRLVRRSCIACHGAAPAPCPECAGTGFRGRLAILEVLIASAEFERCVADGASVARIAEVGRAACADGEGTRCAPGRSLWLSGLEHVEHGDTTLDELLRVASPEEQSLPKPVPPPMKRPLLVAEDLLRGDAFTLLDGVDGASASRYLPHTLEPGDRTVAEIRIGTIDVYVIRPLADGWRVLVLQRALDTRCPAAWEAVHGRIEAGEEPEDAAMREVREETGLAVARLYNVTVQPFYLHTTHTVQVSVVFAAFVDEPAAVSLGGEHQRYEWLAMDEALDRMQWPREAEALTHIRRLLRTGDAGPAEDVLRVR